MDMQLYDFIRSRKHHAFRHTVDWDLPQEFSARGLSMEDRMAERFERLCREEKAVILPGEQIDAWIRPGGRPEDVLGYAVTELVAEKAE